MSDNKTKAAEFSDFEKSAMRERAKELREEAKVNKNREAGEKAVMTAIEAMTESEQFLARKIHEIVQATAPALLPKTWYGMPAYADKDGKVVCFFQAGTKYESRYSTIGFTDKANLDDGNMWATTFALVKLTKAEEDKITELVKKAVS